MVTRKAKKNSADKVKRCSYKRKSMKGRMKKLRKKKRALKGGEYFACYTVSLYKFPTPSTSETMFFMQFCRQYIFNKQGLDTQVPYPICHHIFVPYFLVEELLCNENMEILLHRQAWVEKEVPTKSYKGYLYAQDPNSFTPSFRIKLDLLPFVTIDPNFYPPEEEEENDIDTQIKKLDPYYMQYVGYSRFSEKITKLEEVNPESHLGYKKRMGLKAIARKNKGTYCVDQVRLLVSYRIPTIAFLERQKTLIIKKYFYNVLVPYFATVHKISLCTSVQRKLLKWIARETENYPRPQKKTLDIPIPSKKPKTRIAPHCEQLDIYKKTFFERRIENIISSYQ